MLCPLSGCTLDCQRRAPVRVPCTCGLLVCRKCAGVAGAHPSGCGLCLRPHVEFTARECVVDGGLLLALAERGAMQP